MAGDPAAPAPPPFDRCLTERPAPYSPPIDPRAKHCQDTRQQRGREERRGDDDEETCGGNSTHFVERYGEEDKETERDGGGRQENRVPGVFGGFLGRVGRAAAGRKRIA